MGSSLVPKTPTASRPRWSHRPSPCPWMHLLLRTPEPLCPLSPLPGVPPWDGLALLRGPCSKLTSTETRSGPVLPITSL